MGKKEHAMKRISKKSKRYLGGAVFLLVLALSGLTAAEICIQPPDGLVSWWPGDGNANDIQSGNNGMLEGGAAFDVGMVEQAFSFNGVNGGGGVNLGNVTAFDFTPTSSFTIDAWINSFGLTDPSVQDTQFIISLNYQCSNTFQGLAIQNTTGKAYFAVRDDNGMGVFILSPSPLSANTFHHIAGVREVTDSGKTVKLYVDGVLVATAPDPSTGPLARNTTDFIGRRFPCADTGTFNGLIDEVEIFNRALSAAKIQAIFAAGSAGKCKVAIQIDIKPGEFPNNINLSSRGRIPVAILTTDATDNVGTFDATTVDPTTVRFGSTGTEATPVQDALEDVDGDGDTDMILRFNTQDTGIECGDTSATLTGQTFDGQTIHGTDSIETVGCK